MNILDKYYLQSEYPTYRTASIIDFSNRSIIHVETNTFVDVSCKVLDLSFNSLTLLHSNQLFSNKEEYSNVKSNHIKLKTLKLNNNKLNEISSLFEYESTHYPLLTHIHLEFNLLTEITANTFTNVKSLTHLSLNNNQITFIHRLAFENLLNLLQIHLYNNPLSNYRDTLTPNIFNVIQLCTPANNKCVICFSSSCNNLDIV